MLDGCNRVGRLALILAFVAIACADVRAAEPDWQEFLKRGEIEAIRISPNGEFLALAEREAQVRTALAGLSKEQAAIVHLSFFAEKPHSEIARELGVPLGTVKSRIRLALNRLRALLGDET